MDLAFCPPPPPVNGEAWRRQGLLGGYTKTVKQLAPRSSFGSLLGGSTERGQDTYFLLSFVPDREHFNTPSNFLSDQFWLQLLFLYVGNSVVVV